MSKNKLERWRENETFAILHQPSLLPPYAEQFYLKGKWHEQFFKNQNPITLELGCGRGEYSIGMARIFPRKNFIGIDIKGARLWKGAKSATAECLPNIGFVRTRIEAAELLFAPQEINEIWLPFPDPQPSKPKKRLWGANFFNKYKHFLAPSALIHLKTDNTALYSYALALLEYNNVPPIIAAPDLYAMPELLALPPAAIQTYYETMFRREGKCIAYLQFAMPKIEWKEIPPSHQ